MASRVVICGRLPLSSGIRITAQPLIQCSSAFYEWLVGTFALVICHSLPVWCHCFLSELWAWATVSLWLWWSSVICPDTIGSRTQLCTNTEVHTQTPNTSPHSRFLCDTVYMETICSLIAVRICLQGFRFQDTSSFPVPELLEPQSVHDAASFSVDRRWLT